MKKKLTSILLSALLLGETSSFTCLKAADAANTSKNKQTVTEQKNDNGDKKEYLKTIAKGALYGGALAGYGFILFHILTKGDGSSSTSKSEKENIDARSLRSAMTQSLKNNAEFKELANKFPIPYVETQLIENVVDRNAKIRLKEFVNILKFVKLMDNSCYTLVINNDLIEIVEKSSERKIITTYEQLATCGLISMLETVLKIPDLSSNAGIRDLCIRIISKLKPTIPQPEYKPCTSATVESKTVEPKKVEPKKDEPKKVEPKKDEPKKVEPKKVKPVDSEDSTSEEKSKAVEELTDNLKKAAKALSDLALEIEYDENTEHSEEYVEKYNKLNISNLLKRSKELGVDARAILGKELRRYDTAIKEYAKTAKKPIEKMSPDEIRVECAQLALDLNKLAEKITADKKYENFEEFEEEYKKLIGNDRVAKIISAANALGENGEQLLDTANKDCKKALDEEKKLFYQKIDKNPTAKSHVLLQLSELTNELNVLVEEINKDETGEHFNEYATRFIALKNKYKFNELISKATYLKFDTNPTKKAFEDYNAAMKAKFGAESVQVPEAKDIPKQARHWFNPLGWVGL